MKVDEKHELKKTILLYCVPFSLILFVILAYGSQLSQWIVAMDIIILALLSLKLMVDLRRYFDNREVDDDNGGLLIKE